jgi:hypothetical protein
MCATRLDSSENFRSSLDRHLKETRVSHTGKAIASNYIAAEPFTIVHDPPNCDRQLVNLNDATTSPWRPAERVGR